MSPWKRSLAAAALIGVAALPSGALAQDTDSVPPHPAGSPDQPRHNDGSHSDSSGSTDSLSHELSRSGGVIHPPPTGDRNEMPPPQAGSSSMPVIPPPGTPGGDQRVQPK